MKEVRIVLVYDAYSEYEDSNGILQDGVSDWEQISDDDYKLLKNNWANITSKLNVNNARPVLLEKDSVPVKVRIDSIKSWIQQERDRQENEAQERKNKAAARAMQKLLKNAESERKLLDELKRKYPDA